MTWRRVVLGAGAGVVFAVVMTGFLALTGTLQLSSSGLPASTVLAEALPRACAHLVPWLLLWLFITPAIQRVPFGQPWLALFASAAIAVWLVPRALDITGLSPFQLSALGLFALLTAIPVVRASDVWMPAAFVAALHIMTASIAGMPFGGGNFGVFTGFLNGDELITGGKMGPVFGVFGILGQIWLGSQLVRHHRLVFANASSWIKPRGRALLDLAAGVGLAAVAAAIMFVLTIATGQSRIASVTPSLAALSATLSDSLPTVLASEFVWRYVATGLVLAVVKRGWIAVTVVTAAIGALHLAGAGANALTLIGVVLPAVAAGVAFVSTGRLWLSVGLGYGWALFEGPIFGFWAGGFPARSPWVQQDVMQYTVWSGGIHGPDASVFALIAKAVLVGAVAFYVTARRDKTRRAGAGTASARTDR